MLEQRLIHSAWDHLFAAAIDHFLEAAGEGEPPLAIQPTLIPGEEPAFTVDILHPAALIGAFIASGHAWAADGDLTAIARRQRLAGGPQDRHFRSGRSPDTAGPAP